jgi:hypothetical protein
MNFEKLIISLSLSLVAFLYYKVHKLWLKNRSKNKSSSKPITTSESFQDWIMIIVLLVTSIIFLFQAF